MGQHRDPVQKVGGVLRSGVLIALSKAFRGDHDVIDLVTARLDRLAHAALIQRQPDEGDSTIAGDLLHHGDGVRHFRHRLGIDEARRFHALDPGVDQPVDEVQLYGGFKQDRVVLQAVARSDFNDLDRTAHGLLPEVSAALASQPVAAISNTVSSPRE